MRSRLTRECLPRTAARKTDFEGGAHPLLPEFDQAAANRLMGDLAEEVRNKLSEDYGALPPGLQTVSSPNGGISIIVDDPELGIGVQVEISLLKQGGVNAPQGQTQMGPPGPPAGSQPGHPQGQTQMGPPGSSGRAVMNPNQGLDDLSWNQQITPASNLPAGTT